MKKKTGKDRKIKVETVVLYFYSISPKLLQNFAFCGCQFYAPQLQEIIFRTWNRRPQSDQLTKNSGEFRFFYSQTVARKRLG